MIGVGAKEHVHVEMMFGVVMEMKNDVTGKFYTIDDNALTKELVYGHLTGVEKFLGSKCFLVSTT